MTPLSPVDQLFLWLENRSQPMHVGGLQLFSPPAGADPDYVSQLAESMRNCRQVRAPFNQRLRFRLGQYFWSEDETFDLSRHFRHQALPHPGRIRELLALVSAEHGHHLDRQRPLWQCQLIEGLQDGRFALYTKVHHAMLDGVAAMRLAERALAKDPERRDLPPIWASTPGVLDASRQSPDWLSALGRLSLAAGRQAQSLPAVGRELLKTVYRSNRHPHYQSLFRAPESLLNRSITGSRRFAAQSFSLVRVQRLREVYGTTLNDLVLAICAGAVRRYLNSLNALPDKPLVAMVPISLRRDDSAGGNQVGTLLCSLATDQPDPEKRLRAVQASVSEGKARYAAMTPEEILSYTALTLAPAGFQLLTGLAPRWQTFNLVISNVPGPSRPLYWNGARLEGIYPASIVMNRLALNITVTSYDDLLSFGLVGCSQTLPGLQRLLDGLEASLGELEQLAAVNSVPDRRRHQRPPEGKDKG